MKTYRRPARAAGQRGVQCKLDYVTVKQGGVVLTTEQEDGKGKKRLTRLIVRVRTGNDYWRKRWRGLCRKHNLHWNLVEEMHRGDSDGNVRLVANITSAYEVWGLNGDLAKAIREPEITGWEYAVHGPRERAPGSLAPVSPGPRPLPVKHEMTKEEAEEDAQYTSGPPAKPKRNHDFAALDRGRKANAWQKPEPETHDGFVRQ